MKLAIDIPAETYKAISEWDEPKTKYAAEYMLYQFVKNGKRIEQTNCSDAISRSEAIRVASGYCHWTNIPDELAKLPSVTPAQNVCEDAISRQAVLDAIEKNAYRHTYLDQIIDIVSELPSVTPKHCEDAISRQEVLDLIADYDLSMGQVVRGIHALPSVSTEKTGRWIILDDCEKFIAKCSKCGRIEDSRMISKYPYCHCGAKMEGVE